MITYVVTIQNESETYHLTMTVAEGQNEIINYLNEYIKKESWMISHSEVYREWYRPHYRVLLKECAEALMLKKRTLLPLLARIL